MTKSEIQKTVHLILRKGIKSGANSIHIEQDCEGPRLRYRLKGVLKSLKQQWFDENPSKIVKEVISEFKSMAGINPREKSVPQNGVLNAGFLDPAEENGGELYFSVSTCPSVFGENVTLKRLQNYNEEQELAENQHATHVYEPFERLLDHPKGVILVSGPAGSRRISTVYGALGWLHHPGIKIVTAEDPIAFSLPGVMQTQVNHGRDLTVAKLAHSFLKLDPDVIFLGAMDDEETARKGFEAATGGHLVLSTIQSSDALNTISLLRRLNINSSLIASGLLGVLSQISVKRICQSCIKKYKPEKKEWSILFDTFPSHIIFYKGKGCEECHYTGFRGDIILSELFVINENMAAAVSSGADERAIREMALAAGMKTMIDDGLMKLNHTTLSEILQSVPRAMLRAHIQKTDGARRVPQEAGGLDSALPGEADSHIMSLTVSEPESQKDQIGIMYEKYAIAAQGAEKGAGTADAALFFEFVSGNYRKICGRYQCRSVLFSLFMKGEDVAVSAVPGI